MTRLGQVKLAENSTHYALYHTQVNLHREFQAVEDEISEKLRPLAREFGLALQTVNIIRGMRKDYERGWVFVPRTFYEPLGLTRESLFARENNGKALQVIARLADKAESHLRHGLQYITHIPRVHYRIRLACAWPLFFAIRPAGDDRAAVAPTPAGDDPEPPADTAVATPPAGTTTAGSSSATAATVRSMMGSNALPVR